VSHEGSESEIEQIIERLFTINSMPALAQHAKINLLPDVTDEEYMQKVIRAKEYIRQGDIFHLSWYFILITHLL
jgi:Anthranilate/para-aminobenzoate synthases component I